MADEKHEIDNDLLDLLDEIEDEPDDIEKDATEDHQVDHVDDQLAESNEAEAEELKEDHSEELRSDTPELDKTEEEAAPALPNIGGDSVDLQSIFSDFNNVKEELLTVFREDREVLKGHIEWFEGKVQGTEAKQYHAEGLTSLLATKANSASHAIKLLDSIAHIVSASKNHTGLGSTSSMPDNLDELLSGKFDQDAP